MWICIENYKIKHSMKGKDAANLFKKSGVLQFLIDGYDMLHTQGKEYVLEEIEIFLKNRGYRIWYYTYTLADQISFHSIEVLKYLKFIENERV